ncbi:MAG: hypothetical protein RBU37_14720 [Myxococcota bacterium]|nr:hypothetical protein [Myxococcota bacterium]
MTWGARELGETGQAPNRQELAAMDGEESCKPDGLQAGFEEGCVLR